jgi:hypothetical protein
MPEPPTLTTLFTKQLYTMPPERKPPTLLNIPPELLVLIHARLQPAAKLAMRMTSRHLYFTLLPLQDAPESSKQSIHSSNLLALSACARKAISVYLDFDKKRKGRMYCVHCGQWYPSYIFGNPWNTSSEAEEQIRSDLLQDGVDSMGGPGMLELPEGVCGWHRGHLVHLISNTSTNHSSLNREVGRDAESRYPIQTPPTASPFLQLTPGWWSIPSLLCLHCKNVNTILPYLSNYAGKLDMRESMEARCERTALWSRCKSCDGCDSCGLVAVDCFIRIGKGFASQYNEGRDVGGEVEDKGIKDDEIWADGPGRFVIYRIGGEFWAREWKTSTYLTSHPQRSGSPTLFMSAYEGSGFGITSLTRYRYRCKGVPSIPTVQVRT